MVTLQLAIVLLAVSAPSDTVLLDFSAPWCGPCRAMEPTVDQLSSAGYPVKKVNIDQDRDLARRFQISSVPCFVLVQNGKERGRIDGPASLSQLQDLFASAKANDTSIADTRVRGQSPEEPLRRISPNSAGHQRLLGTSSASTAQIMPVSNPGPRGGNPFQSSSAAESNDISAVNAAASQGKNDFLKYGARLTIEDKDGFSYGSGTIIDTRGEQALVLTCGHIFRDSQGQGKISVDLFVFGAPKKIPGRLVSYNLERDVALVSIRAGVPLTAAPVASEGLRLNPGDRVITVGCNHGGAPTVEESHVLAINKFGGPDNVQVAGEPVQGRSGGGLFTSDGTVVGVCNFADPKDNAGLFAAAKPIHEELDSARLSSVYRKAETSIANNSQPNDMRSESRGVSPRATELRALAGNRPESSSLSDNEKMTLVGLGEHANDAEVICIVRQRGNPNAKSEVIVLDRASSSFMEQLVSERETQASRRFTSLEVPRSVQRAEQSRGPSGPVD